MDQEEATDATEAGLMLVQKLHAENAINDDQRDVLKDMILDEDAILMSFFTNFSDPEDEEDLKQNVINYVNKGNFSTAVTEETGQTANTTEEENKTEDQDDY